MRPPSVRTLFSWLVTRTSVRYLQIELSLISDSQQSQANCPNLPQTGHYVTWLVDALQRIVELNHNELLFPGWSNASNCISTAEKFGIVPLASPSLTKAINRVELPVDLKLPWNSTQECKLYPKLLL